MFRVRGAETGRTYYATVQAVDAGFARSPFAEEVSLTAESRPMLSPLSGSPPRLRVRGRPGATVRVEHSTDLKRWQAEREWVIPGNEMLDVEPEPPGDATARFYRVVAEP